VFSALLAPLALPQISREANIALQLKPGILRKDAPPADETFIDADTQEVDGPIRKLRGHVKLERTDMVLSADEVDFNNETSYAEARGNVHYQNFLRHEEIFASKVEYYMDEEKGKFYDPVGTAVTRVETRVGVLSSSSPFHFEGKWAERIEDKYILHDGMITNCRVPRPWWTLRGPKFDIIPEDRALAYKAIFRLRGIPLFYTPYFYKSLAKVPRHSGFLTPSVGNSTRLGPTVGLGYFWAINRSYDLIYHFSDYTARGYGHHAQFSGKPRAGTDFNAILFGVQDKGLLQPDGTRLKQGGVSVLVQGQSDLGDGFMARGELNYLSSLLFRQSFSQTFNEAIFTEVHSVGYITKQWDTFSADLVFQRTENFQTTNKGDSIVIRKLPELEFSSRDREISDAVIPIWVSFDSSAGLLKRSQPLFQTQQFVDRVDIQPRITTEFSWAGFHLIPSFSARETHYGEQQQSGNIVDQSVNRFSREVFVDLIPPSFARVFKKKTFLGDQLKHVIEPRASFQKVSGVTDFDRLIRFDQTDLVANTTQVEISVTNRLYAKRGDQVSEVLSWEVSQQRYFDPTFGGAIVPGQRNVTLSTADLTAYAFLDGRRAYSPIVSAVRATPISGVSVEWRADYDPLRGTVMDSSFTGDLRKGNLFLSLGHTEVRSVPDLSPNANQFRGAVGFGNSQHRGWNAAFTSVYDFRIGQMQYSTSQVTYNTDCCGLSVQYRRFNFGTRFENQFEVAFAIANIATFGTLKKQERMF
jgi:LPS-assembly protein